MNVLELFRKVVQTLCLLPMLALILAGCAGTGTAVAKIQVDIPEVQLADSLASYRIR